MRGMRGMREVDGNGREGKGKLKTRQASNGSLLILDSIRGRTEGMGIRCHTAFCIRLFAFWTSFLFCVWYLFTFLRCFQPQFHFQF